MPGTLLKLLVKASQQKSSRECERMAAETPEERERRLQQMSTNQHRRLAGETPEERETRLQHMADWQLKPLRKEKRGYSR